MKFNITVDIDWLDEDETLNEAIQEQQQIDRHKNKIDLYKKMIGS